MRVKKVILVDNVNDPSIAGVWGLAVYSNEKKATEIWTANNGSGTLSQYSSEGSLIQHVNVPTILIGASHSVPTGIVRNEAKTFVVYTGTPGDEDFNAASSQVIASTFDGLIVAYAPTVDYANAIIVYTAPSGTKYTGLALKQDAYLYAADFANGKIDVFDKNFALMPSASFPFVDPNMPSNAKPYNVVYWNEIILVAYAIDNGNSGALVGMGNGFISAFTVNGIFIRRVVSGGNLNAPYGITQMPKNFDKNYKCDPTLAVANHGDGKINRYSYATGKDEHALKNKCDDPFVIEGLRSIVGFYLPCEDGKIYYTASPDQSNGLASTTNGVLGYIEEISCKKKCH